jgi:hypothetical protein
MVVKKTYILLLAVVFLFGCKKRQDDGIPDMTLTLASNDAKPMGGKVFRTLTGETFDGFSIENNARPFDTWYKTFMSDYYQENTSAYILISPYVSARKKEALEMKKFISNGNRMLLITNGLSADFKEVFGIGISKNRDLPPTNLFGLVETTKFLEDTTHKVFRPFSYYFYPFSAKLDTPKGYTFSPASFNAAKSRDGVAIEIGSGQLILVTNAEAFSNYFLLTRNNYQYAMEMLEHLNVELDNIFWDEFYRRNTNRSAEEKSIFDAILSIPSLRWAFWLLLLLCGIAIFTNLFRRQRIVPVKIHNKNTTVEFTQTIAQLYYNKKDNRNIAQKMIQYFLEHIRSSYYIPHQKLDASFAALLAGKTNQPLPKTERLVQRMAAIMNGADVSDDLLLELNRQLAELMKSTGNT